MDEQYVERQLRVFYGNLEGVVDEHGDEIRSYIGSPDQLGDDLKNPDSKSIDMLLKHKDNFNILQRKNALDLTRVGTDERLSIVKSLSIADDQNVYLVKSSENGSLWVTKWPKKEEENNYTRIQDLGGKTPKLKLGFNLATHPVLVLEYLEGLDVTDNPLDMCFQLLTTQLKYIHKFAMHQDLKPDNIRKRVNPDATREYFIIDMDLILPNRLGGSVAYKGQYGDAYKTALVFNRVIATPHYASTPLGLPYVSYVDDIYELMLVYNEMFLEKSYKLRIGFFEPGYHVELANVEMMKGNSKWDDGIIDTTLRDIYIDHLIINGLNLYIEMMRVLFDAPKLPTQTSHDEIASVFNRPKFVNLYREWQLKETKLLQATINCNVCSSVATHKCVTCWKPTFLCTDSKCDIGHVCTLRSH